MMIKQEFKVDGEVKKTRKTEAANIAFPPFERSEAAAEKIHELMHADPFPDLDEIMNTPELLKQVEDAARDAAIGGKPPRKLWVTRVAVKDKKGRIVSAIPPDEEAIDLDDDELPDDAVPLDDEEEPSQGGGIPPDVMRAYLITRARIITNNAEYIEDLTDGELANLCAMSRKRFMSVQEWISIRYPE